MDDGWEGERILKCSFGPRDSKLSSKTNLQPVIAHIPCVSVEAFVRFLFIS